MLRLLVHAQGWGNILNLSVLLFFLAVQGQTGPDYSFQALSVTWRMQYALGLLPIMYMLTYRIFYLKESTVWQVPSHIFITNFPASIGLITYQIL